MSIIGSGHALLLASAAEAAAFTVERSLRFNGNADSAYLNRTPSSASNRTTWTWSGWVKRSNVAASGYQSLFTATTAGNETLLYFDTSNRLRFYNYSGSTLADKVTTAVFRDPSAWYHIVLTWDTTNATAADRVRIYINGVRETTFDVSTDAGSSEQSTINNTIAHMLGSYGAYANNFFDGYLADVIFVDGQALTPGDFAETNATTGQWVPKAYTGSYGTNGFRLDFSDDSSVAALGYDAAGSNDWTPNNFTVGEPATTGFKALLYTGNGGTQSVTGAGFSPDLVWIKRRDTTTSNLLYDTIRGTGATAELLSNAASSEGSVTDTDAARFGYLSSFGSDGFTVQAGTTNGVYTNQSSSTYVAWCWDAGSSTVSNTNGSITSSVRANQATGFSVATYTGNGTSGASVGHGLAAAPSFVIVKRRSTPNNDWWVYHQAQGGTKYGVLNLTNAFGTASTIWNDTDPSSSVITLGSGESNTSSATYVAYSWTPISGISSFGSYSSPTNTSQKITVGFKPAFVLIKGTFSGSNWVIFDKSRGFSNHLLANSANNENNPSGIGDLTVDDTGFTIPATGDDGNIRGGGTYIYAAFADHINASDIDSLFDSASTGTQTDTGLGGEVSGNYCTWNPLKGAATNSNGNLDASTTTGGSEATVGTIGVSSGKWYWEVALTVTGTSAATIGIATNSFNATNYVGNDAGSWGYYSFDGSKYNNGSGSSYGSTYGDGDVIGVAFDADNGSLYFYKNGTIQNSGTAAYTGLTSGPYFPAVGDASSGGSFVFTLNAGQRAFAYTAPSGYKALCTTNLPDPTITDPSAYMDATLYTGNGSTQSITGINHSPDFVWIKRRNLASDHQLYDIVRGANNGLSTNLTDAEWNYGNGLTSFDSTGFSLGSLGGANRLNDTHVAWTWDAGTFTASNTDGSITSTVRANASAGFSIVTWTAANPGNNSVGHGLSAPPSLILARSRTVTDDWFCYHRSLGKDYWINLNLTSAATSFSNYWNNFEPDSSKFGVYSSTSAGNNEGDMVAYCWAPVAGYSAFGSFVGGGTTPVFVHTGFRPRFVLVKNASSGGTYDYWVLKDTARDPYNASINTLVADRADQENNSSTIGTNQYYDFVSNGFVNRTTGAFNTSGHTFIYAAFAEHPFKFANAR